MYVSKKIKRRYKVCLSSLPGKLGRVTELHWVRVFMTILILKYLQWAHTEVSPSFALQRAVSFEGAEQ